MRKHSANAMMRNRTTRNPTTRDGRRAGKRSHAPPFPVNDQVEAMQSSPPCVPTSRETLHHWKLVTRAGENMRHDEVQYRQLSAEC